MVTCSLTLLRFMPSQPKIWPSSSVLDQAATTLRASQRTGQAPSTNMTGSDQSYQIIPIWFTWTEPRCCQHLGDVVLHPVKQNIHVGGDSSPLPADAPLRHVTTQHI
eukprot:Protomagalhaensia_wolfi_Nauph_80__1737@NODE_2080_length_1222_cov_6_315300_g1625_i0_p2_GENE_NODE_2080_length_1222_cov_6_315300_g1625_i0NODE_2080_length_1222_cov_6_315300_g1625_i0_p2_ORF_typecomplete_len107_score2_33_NODE_2080_length_1222_cov_6_315300_g1625_i08441164